MRKMLYKSVDDTDVSLHSSGLQSSVPHLKEASWKKTFFSGIVAAGVLLTPGLVAAPIFAAPEMAPATQSASTQSISNDEWQQLESGGSHIVKIKYDAFEKDGRLASETLIELEMGSRGSVAFDVYTADQYAAFEAGKDVDPVGRGNSKSDQTGNSLHDTKLIWANRTDISETFFIRVVNKSAGVSSFHLSVWGNGTTIQNGMVHSEMSRSEIASAQAVVHSSVVEVKAMPNNAETSNASAGYGPELAIATGSTSGTLAAGETRWHTFKYDYDQSSDKPAKQATVQLKMDKKDSVTFEVWTPAQVKSWVQGDEVKPVGAGSVFNDVSTTLIWVGSAKATDRYYVLVENQTDRPAGYNIEISGLTVSY